MIDKVELGRVIRDHKKSSAFLTRKYFGKVVEPDNVFGVFKQTGEQACIVSAGFACESCGAAECLQLHHLITRFEKPFMSQLKYVMQRNYFANILLLCQRDHCKIHNRKVNCFGGPCISQKRIDYLKEKFEVKV